MKIGITGATGLIGLRLGQKLVSLGHELVVFTRRPGKARQILPFPAEIHQWEGGEFKSESLAGCEAFFHLAGEPVAEGRWSEEKMAAIRSSRVDSTYALIEAFAELKQKSNLKTLIVGSAIGIYGNNDSDTPLDESVSAGSDFLAKVCREWEAAADSASRLSANLRIIKLRTGLVLSRQGGLLRSLIPVFSNGLGGRLGKGKQWMSWIHEEDMIHLMIFALDHQSVSGAVNAVAPNPVHNAEFTQALAKALGQITLLPVPEFAIRLAFGKLSEAILSGARVSALKIHKLGFHFSYPDLQKALQTLCAPEREGEHELFSEQWVPKQTSEIFPFFANEKNLESLTPPFLNFSVVQKSTAEMQKGTLIDYKLGLHGIKLKWRTEISSWNPEKEFVDEQLKGPYSKWVHHHQFVPLAGGTLLRDRVRYRLPLGRLGDVLAGWKVKQDIARIFNFRRRKIAELFAENSDQNHGDAHH